MSLIIFSHSDYYYLWNIIEESISKIKDIELIFVYNSNNHHEKPKGFNKYIEYDEKMCYAKRWIHILQYINNEYILVVHDTNIIVEYDSTKIKKLFEIISINNIDRCSMNIFDGNNIIKDEDIILCKLDNISKSKTFFPYDLCPAIWKKKSFLHLWNVFPNEKYRESELNDSLQYFCKHLLNCYGLQYINDKKIYYCIGRPNYDFFRILHITIKGVLLYPCEVYMDSLSYFIYFLEKYNMTNKIKIYNYKFILDNFSPY